MDNHAQSKDILSAIGERLAAARLRAGYRTQSAAVDAITDKFQDSMLSQQNLSRYETGKIKPPPEVLVHISSAYNVSIDWLLTGREFTATQLAGLAEPQRSTDLTPDDLDDYVKVPVYAPHASAGYGALVPVEGEVERLTFKRSWLIGTRGLHPEQVGLFYVDGDSMSPTLEHGDLVMVNRENCRIKGGSIYLVRIGDELMIKRLDRLGSGRIRISSDNRDLYAPYEIQENGEMAVVGEVVWFCRELR